MSLTENFIIIPDFYYNDSGIPTLYNNDKFNNPVTTTKLKKASKTTGYQIKISTKSTGNLNLEQKIKRKSLIPLSVRSTPPPTPSLSSPFLSSKSFFKNSTLLLQHKSHNNNSNNNNNSVTPLITKFHKTTTPATMMKTISKTRVTTKALTTIKNPNRLDNNINNNSSSDIYIMNNYCDKNNQNIFKKKYEIPKKLLTKRATIYQNFEELPLSSATLLQQQQQQQESPSSFSSTETIDTATMLPFTKIMITKNFSNKKSYELINSNNNGNNYHNGTKKIIFNTLMNEFENDKERKNYVNYKIKELNCSKRSKILENYENYNYYLQQQSLNTSDNLNCPKYDDVTNKKYQQNNNNIQENAINRQLDNRITYDMTTKIIKF